MLWRKHPTILMWWIGFFSMILLAAAFYLILGRETKSRVSSQLLREEKTLARAEASNIISFFNTFGNSIAVFSQLHIVKTGDPIAIQENMDAFVDQWKQSGIIGGIALTDSFGKVLYNSNIEGTNDTGAELSDRDYFLWAKGRPKEGEYFVGQPVIARLGGSKGKIIVPVASVVYKGSTLKGVVVASVMMKPLTERYFELMKISDSTDVFLVDQSGKLIYSSNAGEVLREPQNILNAVAEGGSQISFLDLDTGKKEERLIAYSPVVLGNQNWLLVIASPMTDLNDVIMPVYIRQIATFVLVILTMVVLGIIASRMRKEEMKDKLQNKL